MAFRTSQHLNKPATVQSYHDQMHQMWLRDPNSVDESWKKYFTNPSGANGLGELINMLKSVPQG